MGRSRCLPLNPRARIEISCVSLFLNCQAKIEVTGQLNRVRDKMTSRVRWDFHWSGRSSCHRPCHFCVRISHSLASAPGATGPSVRLDSAAAFVRSTSRSKANSYARTLEQGIRQRDKALAETHSKLETLQEEMDKMRQMLEDGARESPYIVDRRALAASVFSCFVSLVQLFCFARAGHQSAGGRGADLAPGPTPAFAGNSSPSASRSWRRAPRACASRWT